MTWEDLHILPNLTRNRANGEFLQVQEASGLLRQTLLHLAKIGQRLAPPLRQAGAAFSAVVQLPLDPLALLEDSVALPITITLLVEAYSGRHKSQPLEAGILEGAYSAVATQEEGSVRPITSSNPVHSELP